MTDKKTEELAGILVSDVNARKAFDVVNIIQNKLHLPVILASSKDYQFQLPLVYGGPVEQLRLDSLENFETDLNTIASKKSGKLIYMPVSEIATRFYIQLKESNKLSSKWRDVLPSLKSFDLARDKWSFQQFCEYYNHPVPRGISINNIDNLRKAFRPVVIKPKFGQGSIGIRYYNKVDDLPESSSIDWEHNLIQERVISSNQVAGAFFLRYKDQIISEYCHQRIRTFPPSGGVTVFSESIHNPEILEIGRKLLKDMDWQGVAMIEFMFDEPSESWRIIELNPRLWGSILLSAFNGSCLLDRYVEASIDSVKSNFALARSKRVFIRWFFPFEILAFLKGELGIKKFLTFDFHNTCYINYTYSKISRSILFFLYFTFNLRSVQRYFKKISNGCF